MDPVLDLQAQVVALRTAVEGIWLSLLHTDPQAIPNAERLRRETVGAMKATSATGSHELAMRDAVVRHTDQLWKSIVWQLGGEPEQA